MDIVPWSAVNPRISALFEEAPLVSAKILNKLASPSLFFETTITNIEHSVDHV